MAKPTKWFKAVKKAFRSPSKERPPPDRSPLKADQGDEKQQLLTKLDFPPKQAHPLPLFEIISHELVQRQPLPQSPQREQKQVREPEEDDSDEEDEEVEEEEEAAATTIQQRFLTTPLALKGLVKLQALVRGHLVRKQAATALRTMKALVRVQAVFRGRRVRMSLKDSRTVRASTHSSQGSINGVVHDEDKVESVGSEEEASKGKRTTSAHLTTQQLKETTPDHSSSITYNDANHPQKGWAWLELWTKTRPCDHNNTRQGGDSDSGKDSYIEINPNQSQYYTTKEVDVNTKVKYYEDYISDLAPKKTNFSSQLMKKELGDDWSAHKPLQIEVRDAKENDQKVSTPPSSSLSEGDEGNSDAASIVNASPQGSDAASIVNGNPQDLYAAASVCHVPETPLVESGGGLEPSCEGVAMEQFVVHVHGRNGGADPALSDSLSASNGAHIQGEDHALGLTSDDAANGHDVANGHDAANGHTSNGHGDGKGEIHVTTGLETPSSKSRGVTCRYMAATKSAEAKFRPSSNSKSKTIPDMLEASPTMTRRYSTGSPRTTNQSPKLAALKSINRRSPSPVTNSKEIPGVDLSPAKRNSLGGDGKRWRT